MRSTELESGEYEEEDEEDNPAPRTPHPAPRTMLWSGQDAR
ncbi:hypothetical protein [Dolichospermum planctonicum]|nr:hypothetical protein [Dolichospermum planctonicum]